MPTPGFPGSATRVLSIPAHHPYVTAVQPSTAHPVHTARVSGFEPDPFFAGGSPTALRDELDLVHLHFGFDHLGRQAIRAWLDELSANGIPLVLTVHDLRNPHHETPAAHHAALTELIPAAAEVITLSDGAAGEIERRYARHSHVLEHPSLLSGRLTEIPATEAGLVVLHLKSLRRNLADPLQVVAAAAAGARAGGGRLRVDLHAELADDPRLAGLAAMCAADGIELAVHPRFDDTALQEYLGRAQVTVLPHRWGTHSGWLELARDLGTRVVAPNCGYYQDQWPEVVSYRNSEETGLDPTSLRDAVAEALALPLLRPADRDEREQAKIRVQQAHGLIYAAAIASASHRDDQDTACA